MEDIRLIADIVYKLGFPVFVAVYLLIRVERKLDTLITLVREEIGFLRDIRNSYFRSD